jgi:uncharacterized membrane protein YphA (DoxX/SURF4 family)
MKKFLENDYLNLLIRFVLGLFFIFFAIGKIADPWLFAKEINNYQIMPEFTISIMAIIIPWLELLCGFLIIFGLKVKSSSFIFGGLLVVFIFAIIIAMSKGLNINCGCFTQTYQEVGWAKVTEDFFLLIGFVYLYFYPNSKLNLIRIPELKI